MFYLTCGYPQGNKRPKKELKQVFIVVDLRESGPSRRRADTMEWVCDGELRVASASFHLWTEEFTFCPALGGHSSCEVLWPASGEERRRRVTVILSLLPISQTVKFKIFSLPRGSTFWGSSPNPLFIPVFPSLSSLLQNSCASFKSLFQCHFYALLFPSPQQPELSPRHFVHLWQYHMTLPHVCMHLSSPRLQMSWGKASHFLHLTLLCSAQWLAGATKPERIFEWII